MYMYVLSRTSQQNFQCYCLNTQLNIYTCAHKTEKCHSDTENKTTHVHMYTNIHLHVHGHVVQMYNMSKDLKENVDLCMQLYRYIHCVQYMYMYTCMPKCTCTCTCTCLVLLVQYTCANPLGYRPFQVSVIIMRTHVSHAQTKAEDRFTH